MLCNIIIIQNLAHFRSQVYGRFLWLWCCWRYLLLVSNENLSKNLYFALLEWEAAIDEKERSCTNNCTTLCYLSVRASCSDAIMALMRNDNVVKFIVIWNHFTGKMMAHFPFSQTAMTILRKISVCVCVVKCKKFAHALSLWVIHSQSFNCGCKAPRTNFFS